MAEFSSIEKPPAPKPGDSGTQVPPITESPKEALAQIRNQAENPVDQSRKLESSGALPIARLEDSSAKKMPGSMLDVLANPAASAQEKLGAAEALGRQGVKKFTIKEPDGTERKCHVQLTSASGGRSMVHVWAEDDQRKDRIALRGVNNGKGEYVPQVDSSGRATGFTGDRWSRSMSGKSALATFGGETVIARAPAATAPELDLKGKDSGGKQPAEVDPKQEKKVVRQTAQQEERFGPPHPRMRDITVIKSTDRGLLEQFNSLASDASPNKPGAFQQVEPGVLVRYQKTAILSDGSTGSKATDKHHRADTYLHDSNDKPLDSKTVPGFVMPGANPVTQFFAWKRQRQNNGYDLHDVKMGDVAIVERNGKLVPVEMVDVGGRKNQGEVTRKAAQLLGVNDDPNGGGTNDYNSRIIIFQGSGDGKHHSPEEVARKAFKLLQERAIERQLRPAKR